MRSGFWLSIAGASALLTCCQSNQDGDILSQQFVHKYGFNVSEKEWDERSQDGQAIAVLKDGVKVTRSFENGVLHGTTTYTFPNSAVVERLLVYDQGSLLKEVIQDELGIPIREELFEFDDRKIITHWDEKGAPLSIEEYDDELLQDGKYFTADHELEAQVESGFGMRVKRDRTGSRLYADRIHDGIIAERTSYHPNGQVHSISRYHDYQLHGEQVKYTASGKPLMKLSWNHGILDGCKTIFRNGGKIAEIPYVSGQKHGVELHYDDLGNLTAEIEWKTDKKHGTSQFHSEESTEVEWFYKGQAVTKGKYDMLDSRERFIAEVSAVQDITEDTE